MGINFNYSNKNEKEIKIAEAKAKVDINESNNRADVDKQTNRVRLLESVAHGVISLAETLCGDSKKEK